MRLGLFYDVETTGKPLWGEPSNDPRQPHIVQLAATLVDLDTRIVHGAINLVVTPNHPHSFATWKIPQEAVDIHGIDEALAKRVGVREYFAMEALLELWEVPGRERVERIGHCESFDARIIRIALKRHGLVDVAEDWKAAPSRCTGHLSRPVVKLPKNKMPTLTEAYEALVGKPMQDAHTAPGDVLATMDLYWALQEGGHIPEGKR